MQGSLPACEMNENEAHVKRGVAQSKSVQGFGLRPNGRQESYDTTHGDMNILDTATRNIPTAVLSLEAPGNVSTRLCLDETIANDYKAKYNMVHIPNGLDAIEMICKWNWALPTTVPFLDEMEKITQCAVGMTQCSEMVVLSPDIEYNFYSDGSGAHGDFETATWATTLLGHDFTKGRSEITFHGAMGGHIILDKRVWGYIGANGTDSTNAELCGIVWSLMRAISMAKQACEQGIMLFFVFTIDSKVAASLTFECWNSKNDSRISKIAQALFHVLEAMA